MTFFHRKPSLRAQFLEEKTQNLQLVSCPKSTLESPHSIGIWNTWSRWLRSNLILFWLFNFPPFFVCIFSSFFFIFPFFISSCTVQCVTFLIFLVGAWLCTSKGKIQWCIKLLSAHHQGPTFSVNRACYKSYEMLILLSNSLCQYP